MKKIFILLLILLLIPVSAQVGKIMVDGKTIQTRYAYDFNTLTLGSVNNIESLGIPSVGYALCIVDVLNNGDLALTFLSDEDLERFHKDTDPVLDKYYGGYDRTSFQYPAPDVQTYVTTMYLRRLDKKKWFNLKKWR